MRLNNLLTTMNITILVHILKVPQLGDIDTLLCFRDMHSVWVKLQIYSIMQVLLPDVTQLLVVTSSLLSDTSADRPSRITADGGKSKTGCQIFSDPLEKSILVHSTLSSNTAKNGRPLSCIQSWMSSKHTSNDVDVHLSHAGYTAVRKKCQDFSERGSCIMFWPVNKGMQPVAVSISGGSPVSTERKRWPAEAWVVFWMEETHWDRVDERSPLADEMCWQGNVLLNELDDEIRSTDVNTNGEGLSVLWCSTCSGWDVLMSVKDPLLMCLIRTSRLKNSKRKSKRSPTVWNLKKQMLHLHPNKWPDIPFSDSSSSVSWK